MIETLQNVNRAIQNDNTNLFKQQGTLIRLDKLLCIV